MQDRAYREGKKAETIHAEEVEPIGAEVESALKHTKRLKELEARQEELDRQILIERSKNAVRVSAEEIKMYYKEALALEAQMLINYLVKEIVMYDDKIEIFFNKPTPSSPDESRGCFVYAGRKESRYGSRRTSRMESSEAIERHLVAPTASRVKKIKKEEPKPNTQCSF